METYTLALRAVRFRLNALHAQFSPDHVSARLPGTVHDVDLSACDTICILGKTIAFRPVDHALFFVITSSEYYSFYNSLLGGMIQQLDEALSRYCQNAELHPASYESMSPL